jgi:hypothetical protein
VAQDAGKIDVGALIAQAMAASAASPNASQGPDLFIPLWKVRPKKKIVKVNPGEIGDNLRSPGGGRVLTGQGQIDMTPKSEFYSADQAASSFLDMDEKDRKEFMQKAIETGLIKPGSDGVSAAEVFEAWQRATNYAASYNKDRGQDKWISPWEAATRMGVSGVAGSGGAYDPFKPRTQTQTTKRDFTKGNDAESVTRNLESIFQQEMGRAPTEQERAVYQRAIQKAYDANPEKTVSTTQTDANGVTTGTTTASGGVDMTATLLDQVRNDPESQAFQAGSTYFSAALQALGAIA